MTFGAYPCPRQAGGSVRRWLTLSLSCVSNNEQTKLKIEIKPGCVRGVGGEKTSLCCREELKAKTESR